MTNDPRSTPFEMNVAVLSMTEMRPPTRAPELLVIVPVSTGVSRSSNCI
jgi:hypothetical protein